ncbi:MAG: type II-A CRISPR-associated protein Csn2 [Lachnospiraceae bacterium]
MKIVNAKYGLEVLCEEGYTNAIILENPHTMSEFVQELLIQKDMDEEGNFLLSQDNKLLKLSKNIDVILDPFSMDVNNKKILSSLYSQMNEIANEDMEQIYHINTVLIKKMDEIVDQFPSIDIQYNEIWEWTGIFKMLGVYINNQYDRLVERLEHYLKIIVQFTDVRLLFFINLSCFLPQNELSMILGIAEHLKINIILVENKEFSDIPGVRQYILDTDNCLIIK